MILSSRRIHTAKVHKMTSQGVTGITTGATVKQQQQQNNNINKTTQQQQQTNNDDDSNINNVLHPKIEVSKLIFIELCLHLLNLHHVQVRNPNDSYIHYRNMRILTKVSACIDKSCISPLRP